MSFFRGFLLHILSTNTGGEFDWAENGIEADDGAMLNHESFLLFFYEIISHLFNDKCCRF